MLARKHPPPCPPVDNLRHILIIINMTLEQRCYARPTTQRYGAFWDRVPGGVELIPIHNTTSVLTPSLRRAYRLNAAALHPWQVIRLVNWYSRKFRVSQEQARWEVLTDFPVYADEVEIVSEQERGVRPAPAFVLSGRVMRPALFLC